MGFFFSVQNSVGEGRGERNKLAGRQHRDVAEQNENGGSEMSRRIRATILSTLAAATVAVLLLAVCAFLLSKAETLPKQILSVMTTVIACIAVLCGGLVSSLYLKEHGILNGTVTAVVFSMILFCISVFIYETEFGIGGLTKFAAILLSGILGGIVGVNRKSRVNF